MRKVIIIAPHPDDETLGCGGSILKHIDQGDQVFWLIMTTIKGSLEYSLQEIESRAAEINIVEKKFGFKETIQSDFITTQLDTYPKQQIIKFIAEVFNKIKPNIIYAPYEDDAHSDHQEIFKATIACCKSFRYPFISTVRIYETLSETGLNLSAKNTSFNPNLWIDISDYLEKKIEIMNCYNGEIGEHPFPRSEESIKALAILRGSSVSLKHAEAFISLKEIIL